MSDTSWFWCYYWYIFHTFYWQGIQTQLYFHIWDVLHDLVLFVQFKKLEKHPWRSVILVKLQVKAWSCNVSHTKAQTETKIIEKSWLCSWVSSINFVTNLYSSTWSKLSSNIWRAYNSTLEICIETRHAKC